MNEAANMDVAWRPPTHRPVERHGTIRDWIEAGTHLRMEGEGPAVVLIHGVGLDLEMWDAQAATLAERYTVVRYDMLGHGASAKPPGPRSLNDFVGQLERLFAYLGLERAAVVGFSMGALVAQAFALAFPDRVARLAVLNGVYDRSPEARAAVRARLATAEREGPAALVDAALARWFTTTFAAARPEVLEAVRARLAGNDRHGFLATCRVFAEADAELAGRLGDIRCPTLVMTAEEDGGSTPAMAIAMARAIPGANCVVLPELRHMAPVEAPAAVNGPLLVLLDGTDREAAP